eukprot:CAMPEP_0170275684 /NCGR_PEP_ID=MMETSP0116_2-20130129/37824_1 /TAXON_ID=400756 /ORGANISM="Durinskia baltica, Strain CSIRO CS-38" /LENGTH=388 /DNA_ID=CAMNT_0010526951 /DNA_START=3 /DNA_END=1166 /DNA_ORIENTATION=+
MAACAPGAGEAAGAVPDQAPGAKAALGTEPAGMSPISKRGVTGSPKLGPQSRAPPRSATVTSVVGLHGTIVCTERSTLGHAAAQMLARHRSFVLLARSDGTMFGALTENDILHACASGVPASFDIGTWLASGFARLPGLDNAETLPPEATLLEAAQLMQEQAESEFACRHVVISDGRQRRGIVSCMDIVRFFHAQPSALDPNGRVTGLMVSDVMKPMKSIPTCPQRATVVQAMQKMIAFRQNFVVVHSSDDIRAPPKENEEDFDGAVEVDDHIVKHVRGVVTTRDTLRAYVDRAGLDASLKSWVRRIEGGDNRLVTADLPLFDLVRKLATEDIHHVVVVGDGDVLVGAVSSSDIAHALARLCAYAARPAAAGSAPPGGAGRRESGPRA